MEGRMNPRRWFWYALFAALGLAALAGLAWLVIESLDESLSAMQIALATFDAVV